MVVNVIEIPQVRKACMSTISEFKFAACFFVSSKLHNCSN